jgi:MFS family permease
MQIPIGFAVDRFNPRILFAIFFAFWSLACSLTGLASTFSLLILARIALGLGECIYLPGATTIVSRLFAPPERGLPSGIFNSGARTGLVIGGPFLAGLVVEYGWRKMFILVGAVGLLWLVPWLVLFPRSLPPIRDGRENAPLIANQRREPVTVNRNLLGICIGFFCLDFFAFLFLTWLPDYLVEVRHLSVQSAGTLIAVPYLVFGLSEPLGGWICDRWIRKGSDETRTRKVVIAFGFGTALLVIPGMLIENNVLAMVFISASSLIGLSTANVTAVLQSCAPPTQVGIWTGIENCAGNMGGVVAPMLMGVLVARTGSYIPGFALGCILMLVGAAAYWFVVGELRTPTLREKRGELSC